MGVGNDQRWEQERAQRIGQRLRDLFALGALDFVYQDVARLLQFERAALTMGEYLARLELLRRNAVARAQAGGVPAGAFCLDLVHAECSFAPSREVTGLGRRAGECGGRCGGKAD